MNVITIFSCGPERPQICHDGNDSVIGTGLKDAMGNFVIIVAPALRAGQIIYATDGCFAPLLIGADTLVGPLAEAPVASRWGIVGLIVLLSAVAAFGLRRRSGVAVAGLLLSAVSWLSTRSL